MRISDWSSDVCSSDLRVIEEVGVSSRQVGYLDIKTIGEEHRMIDAEKIVRDFCAAWGEGKVEKPDPDTIAGYFATEGEWHLWVPGQVVQGREAIRARSEEHTSELQSLMRISYAVFCLKKKKTSTQEHVSSTAYQLHNT